MEQKPRSAGKLKKKSAENQPSRLALAGHDWSRGDHFDKASNLLHLQSRSNCFDVRKEISSTYWKALNRLQRRLSRLDDVDIRSEFWLKRIYGATPFQQLVNIAS